MSILISYSLADAPFALKIGNDLQQRGVNLLVDRWDIPFHEPWTNWQQRLIAEADAFLVVMSPDYIASTYCQAEWGLLTTTEVRSFVVVARQLFHEDWLTENLERGYLDFSDSSEPSYQTNLQQLIAQIRLHLPSAIGTPLSEPAQLVLENLYTLSSAYALHQTLMTIGLSQSTEVSVRPKTLFPSQWLSLPHFSTKDGVSLEGQQIVNFVLQNRTMYLVGASGAGKTTTLESIALIQWQRMWLGHDVTYLPLLMNTLDATFYDKLNRSVAKLQQYFPDKKIILLIDDADYSGDIPSLVEELLDHPTSNYILGYLFATKRNDLAGQLIILTDWTPALGKTFISERFGSHVPQIAPPKYTAFWCLASLLKPQETSEIRLLDNLITALWTGLHQHEATSVEPISALIDAVGEIALDGFTDNDPYVPLDLPNAPYLYGDFWFRNFGEQFFFRDEFFLRYFATQEVIRRGVVASLDYPNVTKSDGRVSTPVDQLIADSVELSESPSLLVQEIADVDALLAVQIGIKYLSKQNPRVFGGLIENALSQVKDQTDLYGLLNTLVHQPTQPILDGLISALRSTKLPVRKLAYDLVMRLTALKMADQTWQHWAEKFITVTSTLDDIQARVAGEVHVGAILLQHLQHPSSQVRQASARLLSQAGDESFIYPMSLASYDEDEQVATMAVSFLTAIKDELAVQTLIDLSNDVREKIKTLAARSLQQADAFVHEVIYRTLVATKDKDKQVNLLNLLRGYDSPHILQKVLGLSEDADDDLRTAAILALENQSHPEVIDRLMKAQSDEAAAKRETRPIRDIARDLLRALGFSFGSVSAGDHDQTTSPTSANQLKDRLKAQRESHSTNELQGILHQLKHGQVSERIHALARVTSLASDDGLIVVNHALLDSSRVVRLQAIQHLANMNSRQANKLMMDLLLSDDPNILEKVQAHLLTKGTQLVPQLVEYLDTCSHDSRVAVIELLGRIGDPFAVGKLSTMLSDQAIAPRYNKRVCDASAEALQKIGTKEALNAVNWWKAHHHGASSQATSLPQTKPPVLPDLGNSKVLDSPSILPIDATEPNRTQVSVSRYDAQSIPLNPTGEVIENTTILNRIMYQLLKKEWGSREDAAKALREYAKTHSHTENQALIAILTPLLENQDWSVRSATIEALAWLHDVSVVPSLIPLLADEKWVVQATTVRALTELKDVRSVSAIIGLLKAAHPNVREAAAEALGVLRSPEAFKALKENLQQDDAYVRLAIVLAISQYGEDEKIQPLLSVVNDDHISVRWATVQALAKIRSDRVVPTLINALEDQARPNWEDERICDLALTGLRQISSPQAIIAIEAWKKKQ